MQYWCQGLFSRLRKTRKACLFIAGDRRGWGVLPQSLRVTTPSVERGCHQLMLRCPPGGGLAGWWPPLWCLVGTTPLRTVVLRLVNKAPQYPPSWPFQNKDCHRSGPRRSVFLCCAALDWPYPDCLSLFVGGMSVCSWLQVGGFIPTCRWWDAVSEAGGCREGVSILGNVI